MRGKQPKEREKYVIRMGNGTLVEVNREIYLEWYRVERRERYQRERDRKHGVCSMEALEEKGCFPEMATMNLWNVTEENALYNIYRDKLMKAIGRLPKQDAQLIKLIYFDECTVKKTAEILGCNRKSIENRKKRIFRELCRMIEKY